MSTLRALFGIIGGFATGYIIGMLIAGHATERGIGVAVAVIAATVIGIHLIRAIQSDQKANL